MNLRTFLLIAFAAVIAIPLFARIYTDYLWFQEVTYVSVFLTILTTKLWIFPAVTIFFFIFLFSSLRHAAKNIHRKLGGLISLLFLISMFAGFMAMNGWDTVLKYFNQTSFGLADPVFNNDLSFYIFSLPFYWFVWSILFSTVSVTALSSLSFYLSPFLIRPAQEFGTELRTRVKIKLFKSKLAIKHLLWLGGIIFILVGIGLYFYRYSVLNSTYGVVYGAGYTDLTINLPLFTLLSFASGFVGILLFGSTLLKSLRVPTLAIAALIGIALVGGMVSIIVQQYKVVPDEYNYEKPYLSNNIRYTRLAYGLADIKEVEFPAEYRLTLADIEKNNQTVENIRLWDWRPMIRTYKQIQLIRTYYDFNDVDVDRYYVDGAYKQVLISAREVNSNLLPDRSWVNEHLVFTHGYGVAMSPVSKVSAGGLPLLYIRDIPPKSEFFDIKQPEIYFGELTTDYVITNTMTEELDYPKGEINVYTTYKGTAGIELSYFKRLAMTLRFGSLEILFSGSITPDSKILINRNIIDRIAALAPFLKLDRDPYAVVADGRLYWIADAYTVSDRYPYSQSYHGINYIRNSVKVVIDAYNGDTTFYVIEPEPIIQTYRKIFPSLFKSFEDMPDSLKAHVRYPIDLFVKQTQVYKTYHMQDTRVFYNKEDVWEIPQELYERTRITMEPYYLIMKLPEEKKEEFILLMPFTPRAKNNIIGWMAARCDSPNYGERIVFMFPKEKLIFGPMQIEARIDQDPEISQKFTLWDQIGTRVVRGNLLVIPIEDSLLYVEPIYLRAEQVGALPELKRVVVAFGDKLTMQETLDKSLEVIFGKAKEIVVEKELTIEELISQALQHYTNAQEFLKQGNWQGYGIEQEKLKETLEQLQARQ